MQASMAALVAETSPEQLADEVIATASAFLLDTLAIGVAGYKAPYAHSLRQVVATWGSDPACRLLGGAERLPAASVAYLNAFQMHCLEFDCVHEPAVAHVLTAPVAAAMAECQQRVVNGETLLVSLVLGAEIAATLGLAATASLAFFRPATTGVFGAAATIARLRGYDAGKVLTCFGHALSQAAGTMQAHAEGKPTLPLQLAAAARAGIIACDLADAGIPAPINSVDGSFGYLSLFETSADAGDLARTLGKPWRITELSHKPFPSGRATHGAIDAVMQLRQQGVSENNLHRAELRAPPLVHQLVVRPAVAGMNANYARLCYPYTCAAALFRGQVNLDDFTSAALNDAQRLETASRFLAVVTDESDPAAFTPQAMTARLRDGRELEVHIEHLPGSPNRPLTCTEISRKVRHCLAATFGKTPAAEDRARQLLHRIEQLPRQRDCRVLLEPLAA